MANDLRRIVLQRIQTFASLFLAIFAAVLSELRG
jgi:hypothetical protein